MPRARHAHAHLPAGSELAATLEDYALALRAAGKAEKTVGTYVGAAEWLIVRTAPATIAAVTRKEVRAHLAWLTKEYSAAYASNQFRALQAFGRYLAEEESLPNPMLGLKPIPVPDKVVPVVKDRDLDKLLATCSTRRLSDVRDAALIRMLASSGARRAEVANLKVGEVDAVEGCAMVTGKGSRMRMIRFDSAASQALARYLRARRRHRGADASDALWLGQDGRPLQGDGVYQAFQRRAQRAGVTIYPHQLRHTFSHRWLASGGQEADLMQLNGWRSASMVRRYGASAAAERASAHYDEVMGRKRKPA